jgi:nitrous oxidase accessory protein NosD
MPATATDRLNNLTTSVAVKAPVRTISTANLTLSGLQTVGGVTVVEGDRVLVKNQTDTADNGIYVASTSAWQRSEDFDGNRDVAYGTLVVAALDNGEGLVYQVTSTNPVVIGTSAITFRAFTDPNRIYEQTEAEALAAVTPTNYSHPPGDIRRYGALIDGVTSDSTAWTRAIASNDNIFHPGGTSAIGSALVMRSGITIYGLGNGLSRVHCLANNFSAFTDNDVDLNNVTIRYLWISAVSSSTSNRGILFDADTTVFSENITVENVRVTSMFRGVECDRVRDLKVRDCRFSSLNSVGVYVGSNASTGRSTKVTVSGCTLKDNGSADTEGGMIISFVDEVAVIGNQIDNVGAPSGSTNLYHGIYLRTCNQATVAHNTLQTLKRGAGIVVYADVPNGETACTDVTLSGNVIQDAENYVGIRCDNVNDLAITGNVVRDCYDNAMYLTTIDGLTVHGNVMKNNNVSGTTGMTAAAAIRAQAITFGAFTGNTAIETEAAGADYGQGGFIQFAGTNSDITVTGNVFRFSVGSGGNGYYFCEASGAINRGTFSGNIQRGASKFFNEGTTCADLTFFGNVVTDNGTADFLAVSELHRFAARGNMSQGTPSPYESDGVFITARLSAAPASATWAVGDMVWFTVPTAAADPGAICTTAGTPGAWSPMADLD